MKNKSINLIFLFTLLFTGCTKNYENNSDLISHHFETGWHSNENIHWHVCTDDGCDKVSENAEHTFEWIIDQEATYESSGSKHLECSVCHYEKKSEIIPQLIHHYSEEWSYDANQHWHACTDENCTEKQYGSNLGNHVFQELEELEPTYTNPGHTEGVACEICGLVQQGKEIPALNLFDYTRTTSFSNRKLTETWTLNNPSSIGRTSYQIVKTLASGIISVFDYSNGNLVKNYYNYKLFDDIYDGIETFFDNETKSLEFKITKKDGYIFENVCIVFPSNEKNTITITGNPLTIIAPRDTGYEGLSFDGSTGLVSDMCTAIIDTDVNIVYPDNYPSTSKNGLKANFLNINSGGSLKVTGFANAICAQYTPININGEIELLGNNLAVVSNNSSKVRDLVFSNDIDVFYDGEYAQTGGGTNTDCIKTSGIKRIIALSSNSVPSKNPNNCEHNAIKNESVINATCEHDGKQARLCKECGKIFEEYIIPKYEHHDWDNGDFIFDDENNLSNPNGIWVYSCEHCETKRMYKGTMAGTTRTEENKDLDIREGNVLYGFSTIKDGKFRGRNDEDTYDEKPLEDKPDFYFDKEGDALEICNYSREYMINLAYRIYRSIFIALEEFKDNKNDVGTHILSSVCSEFYPEDSEVFIYLKKYFYTFCENIGMFFLSDMPYYFFYNVYVSRSGSIISKKLSNGETVYAVTSNIGIYKELKSYQARQELKKPIEEFTDQYRNFFLERYSNKQERISKIYEFVVDKMIYDTEVPFCRSLACLVDSRGVCEGDSILFNFVCRLNDINSYYVWGTINKDGDDAHGWNIAEVNGLWYYFDTQGGKQPGRFNYYFGRTYEHAYIAYTCQVIPHVVHFSSSLSFIEND